MCLWFELYAFEIDARKTYIYIYIYICVYMIDDKPLKW